MIGFAALPPRHRALFVLLLVGSAWIGFVFAVHTASQSAAGGMWLSLIGFVALALVTLMASGSGRPGRPGRRWPSCRALAIGLYAWATNLDRLAACHGGVRHRRDRRRVPHRRSRVHHPDAPAAGLLRHHVAFPAWVAAGGLFLPAQIDEFLPFRVPPLHARFIGAMYIAGATMMLLAAASRAGIPCGSSPSSSEYGPDCSASSHCSTSAHSTGAGVRPGSGGLPISGSRSARPSSPGTSGTRPATRDRRCRPSCAAFSSSRAWSPSCLRSGCCWRRRFMITALALEHHAAADANLQRAVSRLRRRQPLRRAAARLERSANSGDCDVVLTLVAVVTSFMHSALFNAANPSTWVWFGGLGLAALALAAFVAIPRLRTAAPA